MVTEKRVLNCREVEAEYDGRWFLLDKRDFPPEDDMGYLVAFGDGSIEVVWASLQSRCESLLLTDKRVCWNDHIFGYGLFQYNDSKIPRRTIGTFFGI
jgi:hypothetical protein